MVYKFERVEAIRAMRGKIWSPGRPSTARRENRVRFWQAVGGGLSTEDAAGDAGESPAVGSRWFRDAGGMPPLDLAPVSGRYLSFPEREETAILQAQHVGMREIARRLGRSPLTISREVRRNASTRSNELAYRASTAQVVSERLGHNNPVFTIDTYQHVLPGMQAEAARIFAQLVAPAASTGNSR